MNSEENMQLFTTVTLFLETSEINFAAKNGRSDVTI